MRNEREPWTDIEVELKHTTDIAILVVNDKGDDVWIPKSLTRDFKDRGDGICTFRISEHWATEKELV